MSSWRQRPQEVANLLNPAFLAVTLRDAIGDYAKTCSSPMPIQVAFLCLPLALHREARDCLPGSTQRRLGTWWEDNAHLRIRFVERVRALVGPTREAIVFGTAGDFIRLENGTLSKGAARLSAKHWMPSVEMKEISKAARFTGRWFAGYSVEQVFGTLGVRP